MKTNILIAPDELADLKAREHVVVIDTRDPASYVAGHIPDAVNVHEVFTYLATSTPEGIAALRATFAEAFGRVGIGGRETVVVYEHSMTPVLVYCFKGARAANTLVALREAGLGDVRVYLGSWNEWSRDPALPIDEGFPRPGGTS